MKIESGGCLRYGGLTSAAWMMHGVEFVVGPEVGGGYTS